MKETSYKPLGNFQWSNLHKYAAKLIAGNFKKNESEFHDPLKTKKETSSKLIRREVLVMMETLNYLPIIREKLPKLQPNSDGESLTHCTIYTYSKNYLSQIVEKG
jgi:hypothetical protein